MRQSTPSPTSTCPPTCTPVFSPKPPAGGKQCAASPIRNTLGWPVGGYWYLFKGQQNEGMCQRVLGPGQGSAHQRE